MEQSPSWEASRFSGSQEIPLILWNPLLNYRIHNWLPTEPFRFSPYTLIHLPEDASYYYPLIFTWFFQIDSFPLVSPPKSFISLFFPPYALLPRSFYTSRFYYTKFFGSAVQIIKLSIMYSSPI